MNLKQRLTEVRRSARANLSDSQKIDIRNLYEQGYSIKVLCIFLGCNYEEFKQLIRATQ